MSTITRKEFISYVKEGRNKSWHKIIRAYCEEFDKNEEDINKLLTILPLIPTLIYEFYDIAREYFFIKFKIITLKSKNGIIIDIY